METVKVFVGKGGSAGITCPYCQKHHLFSVEKYKGAKRILVTRCSCQQRFTIELNLRQFHRKAVELVGKFLNVSTRSGKWHAMMVIDLSLNGIGFTTMGSTDIKEGHQVRVRFTLDNKRATEIEREVSVVNIRKKHYGCQLLQKDFDKELGFYLGN